METHVLDQSYIIKNDIIACTKNLIKTKTCLISLTMLIDEGLMCDIIREYQRPLESNGSVFGPL